MASYTIDPEAGGYGIYLVLWFGKRYAKRPPKGERPDTPKELEERLRGKLTEGQARRISVCVMDVSGNAPGSPPS